VDWVIDNFLLSMMMRQSGAQGYRNRFNQMGEIGFRSQSLSDDGQR
jgi:hypothetical protein